MRKQRIEVRPLKPVVIETPEGLIKIQITHGRKLMIELPGEMRAWHGEDRAKQNLRFLEIDGDRVKPKFEVLTPVKDDEGNLVGIDMPEPIYVEQ